jgi:hypothetical protein
MKQIRVWLAATLLAASAGAAGARKADTRDSITLAPSLLEMPMRIGPMVAEEQPHRYPDTELGVSYQYHAPGLSLTIYIYDGGVEQIPDGTESIPVCQQFEIAKQNIRQSVRNARLTSEHLVRLLPPADLPLMREAVFEGEHDTRPLVTFVWITALNGHFIKLRFTSAADLRDELPDARRAVLSALGAAIEPYLKSKPMDVGEPGGVEISLHPGKESEVGDALLYNLALTAELTRQPQIGPVCGGIVVPTLDAEVAVFRRAFGSGADTRESDFAKDIGKIDAAGFLAEYLWLERYRAAWGATPPATLKLKEFARWKRVHLRRVNLPALGTVEWKYPRPLPLEPVATP